ncbi:hypothetical protein ACFFQW_06980 [Umezawaea endophytica]|uniref:Uncharacterized protein n=1 Tax=Umezawaea endophytica TaxID=1654476 RepID=A0A9X2VP69_9PSEU|nr:hypothetical protein [Umezawaea endophytica]MCS7480161.1 hypothetical protein [Umezawaea endophytica]
MAAETDPKSTNDIVVLDGEPEPTEPGTGGEETNGGPYQTHEDPVPTPGGGGGGAVPNGGPYQTHSEPVPAN